MKKILSIILILQTIVLFANEEMKEKFCIENSFYLVKSKDHASGSTLLKLDLKEYGKFEYINEIPSDYLYNAIGYNPNDGFLYGIDVYSKYLLKIDINNGAVKDLGKIKNLPYNSYVAGDLDDKGNFYILNTSTYDEIFRIDLEKKEAISIKLPIILHNVYDISYSSEDSAFYGISGKNNTFYQIKIENDTAQISFIKYDSIYASEFGSTWIDDNNSIVSANLFTKFTFIDGNLSVEELNTSIDSHYSDGATCQASPLVKAAIQEQKVEKLVVLAPMFIDAPKQLLTDENKKSNSIKYTLSRKNTEDTYIKTNKGLVYIPKGKTSGVLKLSTYDPDSYIDANNFDVEIVSIKGIDGDVNISNGTTKVFVDDTKDSVYLKTDVKSILKNANTESITFDLILDATVSKDDLLLTTNHGKMIIEKGSMRSSITINTKDNTKYPDKKVVEFKVLDISGANFENIDISKANTQAKIIKNEKDIFIGATYNIGDARYNNCCKGVVNDTITYPAFEVGYQYSPQWLFSFEYETIDWSNASWDMYTLNAEYFLEDLTHQKEDELNFFVSGGAGMSTNKNPQGTKGSGNHLALKAGGLYLFDKENSLYLQGVVRYKKFFGVESSYVTSTCNNKYESKGLLSVGLGLRWFF